tara:strand:+ start:10591 stop:13020 length:2430 start_codon:yes stop_codon:yes gene_type:complete
MKFVPNKFPTQTADYRIAIIGNAPSTDEETMGEPFVGSAGVLLKNLIVNSGMIPDAIFFGLLHQVRPHGNNLALVPASDPSRAMSLSNLKADIDKFKPHLIVLLGPEPLRNAGIRDLTVSEMRGSYFQCREVSSPFFSYKCLCALSPEQIQFRYEWVPLLRLDLHKARVQGRFPEIKPLNYVTDVHLSISAVCDKLTNIRAGDIIAFDIEGGANNITCLSIATSNKYAFSIELSTTDLEGELTLIRALDRVFSNPRIGKIAQGSLYDTFAFGYRYHIIVRNVMWDTMLSGWEIYPELPKALGTQASIWTDHPAYKHERTVKDWTTHLKYCCKDSIVTYDLYLRHKKYMEANPSASAHFQFNMSLLPIFLYMELRGMAYDMDKAKWFLQRTVIVQEQLQDRIDSDCKKSININSPKQLCTVLYNPVTKGGLGFPKQHPKKGRYLVKSKLTSNVDAILNLQKKYDHPILTNILAWRKLDKIRTMASVTVDEDKRIRCAYNPVGTDTGRLACYTSGTGSGTNLQTVTKKLRCLYLADEGHYFFQDDLAGADGWTVAARCADLGDHTMLNDYNAGLKPAKIIALLKEHGPVVNTWTHDELREAGKDIGKGDSAWLYFACKRVQHGTNYGLGPGTMSNQILKDGYKYMGQTIIVTQTQCKELQRLYRLRYPGVQSWQNWIMMQLHNYGKLDCASGHVRRFFGRADDNKTIQSAYSHEPQANTTYVTNKILRRIWMDSENRRSDNSLIIQPLHQVHDAVCGQWPIEHTDWAIKRMQHYADFKITIGSRSLSIPAEGFYGKSWGDCDENYDFIGEF